VSEAKIEALNVPLKLQEKVKPHRTLLQDALRRFFRNRLAVAGFVIVIFFLFLAIFADVVAPYRYDKVDFANVRIFPFVQEAHL